MRWLFSRSFKSLSLPYQIINFLFASLKLLINFENAYSTETLLRIPFSVIGRCSLVPTFHWQQRKCERINLTKNTGGFQFAITVRITGGFRKYFQCQNPGLRIRINFIRIRIQHFRPNTNPDPDPIRIQGFNDQKLKKKITAEKKNFFGSKTAIYLSLGLHKVRPKYRRSLQLSKEAIQHFKTWTFKKFLLLWVFFALLDPDPLTRLNPDPIRIRIRNPAKIAV